MTDRGNLDEIGASAAHVAAHSGFVRSETSRGSGRSAIARQCFSSGRQAGSDRALERLNKALLKVARLLEHDAEYALIFIRLEREIELEKAKLHDDILVRARIIVSQNEIGASNRVTC